MRPILLCLSAAHLLTLVLAPGCGGRGHIVPQSLLDTAETHYGRGLLALDEGDQSTAQAQFERARGLDDDFPGSYVGDALIASAQGEYFRAHQSIEQALHRDADFVDAHIALGRIVVDEGLAKGRDSADWLQQATRSFRRAARLSPGRADADYHLARAQARAGELEAALASYQRVIAHNRGALVAKAMSEAERLQIVQRAAPGTKLGARIAMQERITSAELAVLLLEEMKLEELVRQRRATADPVAFRPPGSPPAPAGRTETTSSQMATAWAQPWVQRALELGLPGLEPLPDGTPGAGEIVTRAQFARVVEGILSLLTGAADQMTRYVGEASRFPDVRADHFGYNAIALSVDRGIMRPDPVTGRFRPEDPVSGAEALLIVRELQNAVRMEF